MTVLHGAPGNGPSQPMSGAPRPSRVLLIDDDHDLAASLGAHLTGEGFELAHRPDGQSGLAVARRGGFDVIVLEVLLPGLNGFRVCQALRDEDVWTPILVLTAKTGEYDVAEALDTGADNVLAKPVAPFVLAAHLRAMVRRSCGRRPAPLEVGDLRFDPTTGECARGVVPIPLTPREAAVLEVLMRNAGMPVAKEELLAAVWGPDFDGGDNVVEVYVNYLRKKIDRPFAKRTLRTMRNIGYTLTQPV